MEQKIDLENLSVDGIKVEIRKCESKEGKVYYAYYVNNTKVAFVSIPKEVYSIVACLKNVVAQE